MPRDYYTVTASQLTFNASFPLNGSQMFSALAPVMLFYGGVSVSGGPAFKFSGACVHWYHHARASMNDASPVMLSFNV